MTVKSSHFETDIQSYYWGGGLRKCADIMEHSMYSLRMFVIMASSSLHFQTSNRVQAKKASPVVTDLSDQVSLPHIMSENMSESRWKTRFEPVISFFVPASVT